jgi:hypothetical protein
MLMGVLLHLAGKFQGQAGLSCHVLKKRDALNKTLAEDPFNKAGIAKCEIAEFAQI